MISTPIYNLGVVTGRRLVHVNEGWRLVVWKPRALLLAGIISILTDSSSSHVLCRGYTKYSAFEDNLTVPKLLECTDMMIS